MNVIKIYLKSNNILFPYIYIYIYLQNDSPNKPSINIFILNDTTCLFKIQLMEYLNKIFLNSLDIHVLHAYFRSVL